MVFGNAGFAEADGDDGGVPDRGEAGFDADGVLFFVLSVFEFSEARRTGVIVGVAQQLAGR
jgi:hypothetical protein